MRSPKVLLHGTIVAAVAIAVFAMAQDSATPSGSRRGKKSAAEASIDSGTIAGGLYHNKALTLSCKIPDGWVVRTDELNDHSAADPQEKPGAALPVASGSTAGKVLLAAFSHPPEARAPEVNSSILVAAESAASYPGLQDPGQYFGPLAEVAKSQGLMMDEDLYEVAIGPRTLIRGDFHKDIGSRMMHQSTLVTLSHGYVVSITVIAGTENEIEDLIDGLSFASAK